MLKIAVVYNVTVAPSSGNLHEYPHKPYIARN